MKKNNHPDRTMTISNVLLKLSSVFLFVTVTCSPALAHKVNIFAYVEGDRVYTESYFNDGKKCVNSKVAVLDSSGAQLLEGVTNKEGEFSFTVPARTDLRIVLTASMGHKSEYVLPASELSRSEGEKRNVTNADKLRGETLAAAIGNNGEGATSRGKSVDVKAVQPLIEASLDKKLQPIIKSLIRIEQCLKRPSFTEVIGGIGYIFGIVGIVTYLRSRKR